MTLSNIDNVPLAEVAREEATLALAPIKQRRDDLIAALTKVDSIHDEESMRRATDKIALAAACREDADTRLDPIGTPYRESNTAVRNVAIEFTGPLRKAELAVHDQISAFRRRQREAAAKAKTEQQEREAELRRKAGLAAPVQAPVRQADIRLEPVRSDYRGQVFDRAKVVVSIVDPRILPDTILKAPAVIAALETAVRQLARLTREIPGAKIEDDRTSSVKAG